MKILVVGGGGREHAIVHKVKESKHTSQVYCLPGNAGIAKDAICEPIPETDTEALLDYARKHKIDFAVIGPEVPLCNGIVDEFEANGLPSFGPTKAAAEIEGSKSFAKYLMHKYNIPTAEYRLFTDATKARQFIKSTEQSVVIKADGLAAGKGVIVCDHVEHAFEAIELILEKGAFGSAGRKILIEERLQGEEVSVLALCDGENLAYLLPSQDHKAILDGDKGPNTGGMGAYAPAPQLSHDLLKQVDKEIMKPAIKGMAIEGRPYRGVLYAGLMLTQKGPKVLEFNCRFGDPETQAVLPLAESDLVEAMMSARDGRLAQFEWKNKNKSAVCVVVASGGYPGSYEKGKKIIGLDTPLDPDVFIFHAGTRVQNGDIVTNGGRVLAATALDDSLPAAIDKAYHMVKKITFDGAYYRKDIAAKALKYL